MFFMSIMFLQRSVTKYNRKDSVEIFFIYIFSVQDLIKRKTETKVYFQNTGKRSEKKYIITGKVK